MASDRQTMQECVVIMSSEVQQLITYTLVNIWAVVGVVLVVRAKGRENAHLRRLPPVNGVPLDWYPGDGYRYVISGWKVKKVEHGPVWRAFRQRQADPELEQLRQEAWQRGNTALLWLFGFPVLCIGVAALLIATGLVHPL